MNITKGNKGSIRNTSLYILPIIGFLIMAILVGTEVFWELTGREMVLYQEIVVPKDDLKRGAQITKDQLTTLKIEKSKTIQDAIMEVKDIVGLEARQFIPKGSQLHPLFFESPDIQTNDKQFNWKIPSEWILAAPDSIRRKDRVIIYEVTEDSIKRTSTDKKIQIDATRTVTNDGQKEDVNIQLGLKKDDKSPQQIGERKELLRTTITFVKDSVNREVISTSNNERLDASSSIKNYEANLTLEQVAILESAISKGSKLLIGYTEAKEELTNAVGTSPK